MQHTNFNILTGTITADPITFAFSWASLAARSIIRFLHNSLWIWQNIFFLESDLDICDTKVAARFKQSDLLWPSVIPGDNHCYVISMMIQILSCILYTVLTKIYT